MIIITIIIAFLLITIAFDAVRVNYKKDVNGCLFITEHSLSKAIFRKYTKFILILLCFVPIFNIILFITSVLCFMLFEYDYRNSEDVDLDGESFIFIKGTNFITKYYLQIQNKCVDPFFNICILLYKLYMKLNKIFKNK